MFDTVTKIKLPSTIACISFLFFSCAPKQQERAVKPVVFVSIVPQKYFVDRISGGLVDCRVMVPPGANAHSYEPRPLQMSLLSTARAYFGVGLEFEGAWLKKFSALSPSMKIVHTDSGVPKIAMTGVIEEALEPMDRKNTPHHDQSGLDPHIWLSPKRVRLQAATIERGLEDIDTTHAEVFRGNAKAFLLEIDSLEKQLSHILPCDSLHQSQAQNVFLVFHPTWGYFARDFCLTQISIEVEGKEPSPMTMKYILDTAKKHRIHTVFTQPEFSRKSAEVIARELGAMVIDADGLAYDWKNNLLAVAKQFAAGGK
jgi:zinc transport system substrate-binding protein